MTRNAAAVVNSPGAMVRSTTAVQVLLLFACAAFAASVGDERDAEPETVAATKTTTASSATAATTATAEAASTALPKDVSIIKQINKVNDDGSYTFGYEASDGSFKVESRDVAGNVKGMFGFVDESGQLKRVTYSANNSSGFQAAGGASSPSPPLQDSLAALSSLQTIPPRKKKDDESVSNDGKSTGGVKKVLVSKRPVMAAPAELDDTDRRRGGNDLRRQLPRNEEDDTPDVYGVHSRSSLQSGPVSPIVSALMSELDPIMAYRTRPTTLPASYDTAPSPPPTTLPTDQFVRRITISRQAQEDDEPSSPQYRTVTVQPQQQQQQQQLYRGSKPYHLPAAYPVLPPYQQQPSVVYGPNLASLRDELMELILSFVQARISQLMPYAPSPYPMPYQQPNYYVPSYYQGPRVQGSPRLSSVAGIAVQQQFTQQQQQQQQDDYLTVDPAQQQSSPRVTQTLKDGLIRMLLSTSPRYDPERFVEEGSTPRLTYRRTTQSTPVRNVQIIGEDQASSTRPVTTETPD
ncbi:mediator of RNA polymerase II transcription subunit 15-like [Sipha flava]|uniref:Mediator of RNA polymerase II transcription subunit 15-like n=1 Tax=Sipha flava TaxID=143950 RepID=A0A8B8F769_9HEMI|nr:mediator of RNA polymerase II transcription subunit 15-like [Sipha flava]